MEIVPANKQASLRTHLNYEPLVLKFGTSGRRGEIVHLTQLEFYINALAELEYLQTLSAAGGGIRKGDEFYFACDLRPSSTRFVPEQQGRGELAQAIERAIRDAGLRPVYLGLIPTPAVASYALDHGRGCMMITGSHIPFDRNGYKTYTAKSELLKKDEAPINARVEQVRQRIYDQPLTESLFSEQGMFKAGHQELSPASDAGREHFAKRYTDFFAGQSLHGLRVLVYQHSAVGRDLLVDILRALGATVIPAGRSDTFVPIDTENIDAERLAAIQALVAESGELDAVVSTDGDSDRPLLLAVEHGRVRFFTGDLVGMVVAEYLGADAVVVPISCNDAVDRGQLKDMVEPKTRIGSPSVIAGMETARKKGRRVVCGWEVNGGFFLGSDIEIAGHGLKALPTRDAILPILGILFSMRKTRLPMGELFDRLPKRFGRSALLRNFPSAKGHQIVKRFSPAEGAIRQVVFGGGQPTFLDAERRTLPASAAQTQWAEHLRAALAEYFAPALGFGNITRVDYTDGVRIYFSNEEVAHIRPSGNADELRIYALADTQARADEIARFGIAEPDGILRRLEREISD
jgi:phosphomannomutase